MNLVNRDFLISYQEKEKENLVDSDNVANSVYLVETFYITTRRKNIFQVKLTQNGLCLRKECNGDTKEQVIQLQDIIGCRCLRSKRKIQGMSSCACSSLPTASTLKVVDENSVDLDETDVSAYLYIYAYILKKTRQGRRRERTTLTLRFRSFDHYEDNNREAQKWRNTIKQLIKGEPPIKLQKSYESKRILILLNPKSGPGKAREIFQQRVAPVLLEAEIPYDLHVTKRANFAREFVRTKDINLWHAIVVVGGDGIYWEVINGIMEREDWENIFDCTPIGIIPCGSGNGLAKSIAHMYNEPYHTKPVLGATIAVVKGRFTSMDLVRVETRTQIMFSFLSVGWGFISDIDIESERLRSIGYQRFALWSLHRLIRLRIYKGKVSYLPAKHDNANKQSFQHMLKAHRLRHSVSCNTTLDCLECRGNGDCELCDSGFGDVISLETSNSEEKFRPRMDSWYSAASRKSAYYSMGESLYQSISEAQCSRNFQDVPKVVPMFGPASDIPALTSEVSSTWKTEEGDFIMVHAAYQSHLGSDCHFAPTATPNDGIIWLLIIRGGVSRSQLLGFLLGLSSGTHLPADENQYIQLIPVTAFRIEPLGNEGNITVDGEKVAYGPIQGEIFPGIVKVMVPGYSSS